MIIPDSADYAWIREQLLFRIDQDRAAGGDRAIMAATHEKFVAEHDTSTRERGAPCDACAQPWPCGVVLGILAPE